MSDVIPLNSHPPIRQRLRSPLRLAAVVLFTAVTIQPAFAEDRFSRLESHIPADVQFAMLIDNAADAANQFRATPLGKMLNTPDWQPYHSALRQANSPGVLHVRPWFGVDWTDLSEFSVPVAFLVFRDKKSELAAALMVDSESDTVAAETLLERSKKYFVERGAHFVTDGPPGGNYTKFQLPASFSGSSRPVSLQRQGLLAFVTSPSGADVLQQLWNQTPATSLLQLKEYRETIRATSEAIKRDDASRFWIQPLALAQLIATKPDDRTRSRRHWLASAERQGIDAVGAIGGVLVLSPTGSPSLEVAFLIHSSRPYRKAFQMTSLVPGTWRDPPSYVADSASSWSLFYQDVALWFDGFGFLFDEINDPETPGAFWDVLEAIRKDPEGPQVDIKRDIVGRLSPGVVAVQDYRASKSAQNPNGFRGMYRLNATECDQLRVVFRRCFEGDEMVRASEVGGHVMWSVPTGRAILIDTGNEKEVTITSLAVIDEAILLCTDADWLRSVLLNVHPGTPLSDSPTFQSAKSFLSSHQSETDSLRSFSHIADHWRGPYQELRDQTNVANSEPRTQLLEWLLCPKGLDRRAEILATLPDWTKVGPSLGSVAFSIRASLTGFAGFVGVIPAPSGGSNPTNTK